MARLEAERIEHRLDKIAKAIRKDVDLAPALLEKRPVPLDRWGKRPSKHPNETIDVLSVGTRELETPGNSFGHGHFSRGRELGDPFDLAEPLYALRVVLQGDARELWERFNLNKRAVEIEDEMPDRPPHR
jgi:hypothetical protein